MGGGLIERRTTGVDLPVPQLLAGAMAGLHTEFPIGRHLRAHVRTDAGRWGWSSPQVEAGLTGELVKGYYWDVLARLSVKLFDGVAAYGGAEASGRSEVVRFREGPREVDVSENFTTRLSGTFGIVFRDL
jgi:opacity protein-like surface antigen